MLIILTFILLLGCNYEPIQNDIEEEGCSEKVLKKYNLTNEDEDIVVLSQLVFLTVKINFCESGECVLKYVEQSEQLINNASDRTLNAYADFLECTLVKNEKEYGKDSKKTI